MITSGWLEKKLLCFCSTIGENTRRILDGLCGQVPAGTTYQYPVHSLLLRFVTDLSRNDGRFNISYSSGKRSSLSGNISYIGLEILCDIEVFLKMPAWCYDESSRKLRKKVHKPKL